MAAINSIRKKQPLRGVDTANSQKVDEKSGCEKTRTPAPSASNHVGDFIYILVFYTRKIFARSLLNIG